MHVCVCVCVYMYNCEQGRIVDSQGGGGGDDVEGNEGLVSEVGSKSHKLYIFCCDSSISSSSPSLFPS